MVDRLNPVERIAKHFGLSKAELARRIGTSRQNINSACLEDSIRPILIRPIRKAFPELRLEWIVDGEGPMIENPEEKTTLPESEAVEVLKGEVRDLRRINKDLSDELSDLKDRINQARKWI